MDIVDIQTERFLESFMLGDFAEFDRYVVRLPKRNLLLFIALVADTLDQSDVTALLYRMIQALEVYEEATYKAEGI